VTEPALHVVVVAYRAAAELDRCLAALEGAVPLTVVDNSSAEDVRSVAARRGARYLDARANLGFAGGVNVALRALAAEPPGAVLLLNPDAVLPRHGLAELAAFPLRAGSERVAAVSPRLVDRDGVSQRVVWPFPSPARAWLDALGLGRIPARQTFVVGTALLLRWAAVAEVGPLDERFFLYAEETDWQRRALARGWTSAVCTEAVAEHVGGGTSDDSRRQEALFHAAHEIYVRKWYGRAGWLSYRAAVCLGAVARALVLTGERRAGAGRRALLYVRGPRRCAALAET
jgi:GT2 family glycosyltransferase